jgi:hypothetical protein
MSSLVFSLVHDLADAPTRTALRRAMRIEFLRARRALDDPLNLCAARGALRAWLRSAALLKSRRLREPVRHNSWVRARVDRSERPIVFFA